MVAPAFARMSSQMMRVFRERAPATWIRAGGDPDGDRIAVMFQREYAEVDVNGITISDAQPMAQVQVSHALEIAPERAGDQTQIFWNSGRDKLWIGGEPFDIESCTADGYGLLKLMLMKARD